LVWLAPHHLPETEPRSARFDLGGALSSTFGISALVYGFVRAASHGWSDAVTAGAFVAGSVLLVAFVAIELRAEQPITPLRLFASRERSGSYIARLLLVGGMFGMFFFLTQFLQGVRGYSPLKAGLAFLPMTIALFAMVRVIPRVIPRFGGKRLMAGGASVALVSMVWLSRISASSGYFPNIVVPMLLLGLGIGVAFIPLTAASLAGIDPGDAGAASGLVNVMQQVGGALGLGILVTLFGTASRDDVRQSRTVISEVAQQHDHLAHAIAVAFTGSAVFLALTFAVIVIAIRGQPDTAAS
jgi:predicted MFS family arabinose efflux permease